jgi:prophage DNA circulation protein
MNQTSLREATVILRALLTAVLAAPSDRTSTAAGALRAAVGALSANAAAEIAGFSFGDRLVDIFALLRDAGAGFIGVDTVRAAAASRSAVSALGGVVADAVALQALACECRIVGDTDFVSRDQVDACRQTLMDAFEATIDKAADAFDQVTVQALIGLRAAVVRDLTARARPLPQMINYVTAVRMPALWLAQRLYADAARALDLIAENGAVHPLFMPAAGRALSR